MPTRPPFVTLALRELKISAPIVRFVQRWCNDSRYCFPPLVVDGVFGPHTAQETEELLYRMGAPDERVKPAIGPGDLLVLWTHFEEGLPLPAAWRTRRIARMSKGFIARWGITWRSWKGLHPDQFPPPPEPGDGRLRIYSRVELGLPATIGGSPQSFPVSAGGVFHYQGSGRGAVGLEAAMAQWRAWYRFHTGPERNWSDIGYNWGIPKGCPVGTVFTGRGDHTRGAHAGPGNHLLGTLFMIGSGDPGPTPEMFETAQLLRAEFCRGDATGHRDWMSTSCPGDPAYAWTRRN